MFLQSEILQSELLKSEILRSEIWNLSSEISPPPPSSPLFVPSRLRGSLQPPRLYHP